MSNASARLNINMNMKHNFKFRNPEISSLTFEVKEINKTQSTILIRPMSSNIEWGNPYMIGTGHTHYGKEIYYVDESGNEIDVTRNENDCIPYAESLEDVLNKLLEQFYIHSTGNQPDDMTHCLINGITETIGDMMENKLDESYVNPYPSGVSLSDITYHE